jgi:hypothetical protein
VFGKKPNKHVKCHDEQNFTQVVDIAGANAHENGIPWPIRIRRGSKVGGGRKKEQNDREKKI